MHNTWKIYMLTLISFFVGTSQFAIVGMLDKVAASIDVSIATAGQLTTVFALANAIGTPLVMAATARFDRRKQLLLALVLVFVGVVAVAGLPRFAWLAASYAVLGVGTGVFVATSYATAASLAPLERRARAMSNVSLGFSSSLVFGVPIGRLLATAYNWKWIFLGIGVFALMGIAFVERAIPSTAGEPPMSLRVQLRLVRNGAIATSLLVSLLFFIGYSVLNTYITPWMIEVMHVSQRDISLDLFAVGVASLIGSKLGGVLADRIGPGRTLIGDISVQVVILVLLSVFAPSGIAIALLMLWAIASWTFGPTQNYNLLSRVPEASGVVLGLNSSFVQLGFAAGGAIGGAVLRMASVRAIGWVSAAAVAAAGMVMTMLYARLRKNEGTSRQTSHAKGLK